MSERCERCDQVHHGLDTKMPDDNPLPDGVVRVTSTSVLLPVLISTPYMGGGYVFEPVIPGIDDCHFRASGSLQLGEVVANTCVLADREAVRSMDRRMGRGENSCCKFLTWNDGVRLYGDPYKVTKET